MPETDRALGNTIAMPLFNDAATLELSIRSLLNQSYDNLEMVLCDDGSHDQGLAIAKNFCDPRVLCWSDGRRLGPAARLNQCIDRARSPYLARMGADDIADPDRLEQQAAFRVDHQEVDLCGGSAMVFGRMVVRFDASGRQRRMQRLSRSPSLGVPILHPAWMGRIDWFRRWRYDEKHVWADKWWTGQVGTYGWCSWGVGRADHQAQMSVTDEAICRIRF